MDGKLMWRISTGVFVWAAATASLASGQTTDDPAWARQVAERGAYVNPIQGGRAYANPYANPYTSPYGLNPYMNPYLATGTPPEVGLFYVLEGQRASGGLGSGELSGVRQAKEGRRPAPAGPTAATETAGRPAAFMPHSASRPAGAADHYFNRMPELKPGMPRAADFFHRSGRASGR